MTIPRVGQTWLFHGSRPVKITRIVKGMCGTWSIGRRIEPIGEGPHHCIWIYAEPSVIPQGVRSFLTHFIPATQSQLPASTSTGAGE